MGTTQLAICNTALALIESQDFLTGGTFPNFTGTPAVTGAANVVYGPVRDLLLRQINPSFARITTVGIPVPPPVISPWLYEYAYPSDALRIREVRPPASGPGALADPNERLPVLKVIAFDPNQSGKVVLTNQQNASLVYTSNTPPESVWDSDFAEAMARRIGHFFSMAIAGRPDFAKELLEEAERYASLAAENEDF